MGRPTGYASEIGAAICEQLADGKSLREICISSDMPARSTVFLWLATHKQFSDQYAHAREAQADALVDESLEIADDGRNDWMERRNANGEVTGVQLNTEAVARSKLRCEQRRWWAGKLQPKKYGDKLELASDPSAPLVPILNVTIRKD